MANDDLRFMPAADLAAAIARRKVSPVDAVKAVLDAIDDTKTLNAWVTVDADAALEERYGERIPVLLLGSSLDGVELCHYALDRAAVQRSLAEQATGN